MIHVQYEVGRSQPHANASASLEREAVEAQGPELGVLRGLCVRQAKEGEFCQNGRTHKRHKLELVHTDVWGLA